MSSVREAGPDDLDAVAPLFDAYRVFYGKSGDLAGARAFLAERMAREESVVLLALDGAGAAAGFAQLFPAFSSVSMAPTLILNDLFVAPEARRAGVGARLLDAAARHARAAGAVRLTLSTAHGNRAAQALYEACGWERDTVFRVYHRVL